MNTPTEIAETDPMTTKLSTLWIFVMLNMLFADIFSFMNPEFLKGLMSGSAEQVQITEGLLLGFAGVTEISIAMVLLSRILRYGLNRWANIIAGGITILYVIGGGSTMLHYLFFATIEVVSIGFIIWYAWNWKNPAGSLKSA